MTEQVSNIPKTIGFYWAKSMKIKWYNLIVEVYGESPFFRLRGWNLFKKELCELESWNIEEWGPKIENLNQNK